MAIPTLPFGDADSARYNRLDDATEIMSQIVPSLIATKTQKKNGFLARFATAKIGQQHILASSSSEFSMQVDNAIHWHVLVPFVGNATIGVERHSYELGGGRNALLLPNMRRTASRSVSSTVIASINLPRLQQVSFAMSGEEETVLDLNNRPHSIDVTCNALFRAFSMSADSLKRHESTRGLRRSLGWMI